MPNYKRKTGKKKNYKKQSVDKWQTKQIKQIKKTLTPERKVFDINQDYTADNVDWYVLPVSLMAEGTEYDTRVGRKIKAKSLFIRGQWKINPGATASTARMIAFIDRASNGQVPDPSAVMQVNRDLQSPLDYDNAGTRFIVILDKTFDLSINGTRVRSFKFYRKLWQTVTFNGEENTAAQLTTGHVYLMWLSNETGAADKRMELNLASRFTYTDI